MNYLLGKAPAKVDPRTLKLSLFLDDADLPPLPEQFDNHKTLPVTVETPMFANDRHGCCVIAGRAHQTIVFEAKEQAEYLSIKDRAVLRQYFAEEALQGVPPDQGLILLESIKFWRNLGWRIGRRKYKIEAFLSANPRNIKQMKYAIYLLQGLNVGLNLPNSAATQIQNGLPWEVVDGPDAEEGSWGGHCVYIVGYDATHITCVTWGIRQKLSWEFFTKYCDEAYVICDALDSWAKQPGIDINLMRKQLDQISKVN